MAELADGKPGVWADRSTGGGDARLDGTNGAPGRTSGVWPIARALLICLGLLALVVTVNIFTQLDDAHRRGQALAPVIPITLEVTSGFGTLFSFPVVWLALRLAPPDRRPWLALVALHAAASLAFSALHVALMELFRWAAFGLLHIAYVWSPAEWPYEYRKDLISYLVIAASFWFLAAPGLRHAAPASRNGSRAGPTTFDIRDGAAVWRVPTADILAVRAAGNYVEFLLADGRRPLMRAALGKIEATLVSAGLVRTHRSWLVNETCVRALAPVGSGDYRLDLPGGVSAPLSRRFPEALARLRKGPSHTA